MDKTQSLTRLLALRVQYPLNDIDTAYNRRFQIWLHRNSHKQEPIPEGKDGIRRYEFDDNGFITNTIFSGKTKSGFDLLEQDFINTVLKRINAVNPELLDLDGQKYIAFLKAYFENKEAEPEPQQTERKKYFTKHYVITFILDSFASGNSAFYSNNQTELEEKINKAQVQRKFKQNEVGTGRHFVRTLRDKFSKFNKDNFTQSVIVDKIGENWRDIVLELSDDPKTLKTYLKQKY